MSITASQLRIDAIPFFPTQKANPKETAMNQLKQWGFQEKEQRLIGKILDEWYAAGTLENVFGRWESASSLEKTHIQTVTLKILCYNVQGWGARSLEVTDLIYEQEAAIGVFTEVGELWNSSRIPHFNVFHQHGTNKNGGVNVAVGKHLRASRVDCVLENTVVVDVDGLSESFRLIAIYWPASQKRSLEDLESFIIENTIITGDFNAAVQEWGSDLTDKREKS